MASDHALCELIVKHKTPLYGIVLALRSITDHVHKGRNYVRETKGVDHAGMSVKHT